MIQAAGLLCVAIVFWGCQSAPKTTVGRDGATYTNTIHNFRVWSADGFAPAELRGSTLALAPTTSDVVEQKKPEEVEQFERLRRALADQIYYALESKKIFARILSPTSTDPAGEYKLTTSIVEYYPGNAALRFTVGFGAGYPSITVNGVLRNPAGDPVLRFETQREFEARPFEYTDEQILENNIKDLAVDLADYIDRVVTGKPLKR